MAELIQTTIKELVWFRTAFQDGILAMRPPYQRNPVWAERQKSLLIDSIIRDYPVPEIYLQSTVSEDGDQSHVVVDGQQRIRACLEYLAGEFSLDERDTPDYGDLSFDDLPPEIKKKIFGYKFVVRLLPEMDDELVRTIFARLNRNNMALNRQELRQATYWGRFITTMNDLAEMEYWTEIGIFSSSAVRRMLDVEYISELAVAVLHGLQNKKLSLDKWYEVYEEEFEEERHLRRVFNTVIGELAEIYIPSELRRTRWRKRSDFYSLFYLFAENQEKLPLTKTNRSKAARVIQAFGHSVDESLKEKSKSQDKNVAQYASAVERAATDLGNRKRRHEALQGAFAGVFE